jgi:hypothetical protein
MLFSTASMFLQRSTIIIYGYSELLWNYMRYGRCRNMDVVEYSTCTTEVKTPSGRTTRSSMMDQHVHPIITEDRSLENPCQLSVYLNIGDHDILCSVGKGGVHLCLRRCRSEGPIVKELGKSAACALIATLFLPQANDFLA